MNTNLRFISIVLTLVAASACGEQEPLSQPADCAGVIAGEAVFDQCGVCGGDGTSCLDCAGVIDGLAVEDACGVCEGDGTSCLDCAGQPNGGAVEDVCGICEGDGLSCLDCAGTPNGEAIVDDCGVCGGDNSTCLDCSGVPNGTAVVDDCGVCAGDNSTCLDCSGVPNGTAVVDDCGVCAGDNTTCLDCAGVVNGDLVEDDCGVCGGDNTTCMDCADVPNGLATQDNCGTCDEDTTNDCVQDCNDEWGGLASVDNCEQCIPTTTESWSNTDWDGWYMVPDCETRELGETIMVDSISATMRAATTAISSPYVYLKNEAGETVGQVNLYPANYGTEVGTVDFNVPVAVTAVTVCSWWNPAYLDNLELHHQVAGEGCAQDCHGDWGGTAFIDDCGKCVGGETGLDACVDFTVIPGEVAEASVQGICSAPLTETRSCPEGYVAVGYQGRSGWWFDHIHLICQELNSDGSLGMNYVSSQIGTSHSGNETPYYYCPAGEVLVGSAMRSGDYVDRLEGVCRSLEDIAAGLSNAEYTSTTGAMGGSGGNDRGLAVCPAGYAATGLKGTNTQYPCKLQWECSRVTR